MIVNRSWKFNLEKYKRFILSSLKNFLQVDQRVSVLHYLDAKSMVNGALWYSYV